MRKDSYHFNGTSSPDDVVGGGVSLPGDHILGSIFDFVFRKAVLTTTSFSGKKIYRGIILVVSRQGGIYLGSAPSFVVVSAPSLLEARDSKCQFNYLRGSDLMQIIVLLHCQISCEDSSFVSDQH